VPGSGFAIYSWASANWGFVVTNALMLFTALLGQWILPGMATARGHDPFMETPVGRM
jgi:hypothetical protein